MPGERSDASKSHAICTSRALLVVLPPLQVRCVTLSPRGCPRLQQVHSETPTGPQGQGSMDSVLRSVGVSSRELVVTYIYASSCARPGFWLGRYHYLTVYQLCVFLNGPVCNCHSTFGAALRLEAQLETSPLGLAPM